MGGALTGQALKDDGIERMHVLHASCMLSSRPEPAWTHKSHPIVTYLNIQVVAKIHLERVKGHRRSVDLLSRQSADVLPD